MRYLKMFGLAALAAALMAFGAVGTVSAATLDNQNGVMGLGATITSKRPAIVELPIGEIKCNAAHMGLQIINAHGVTLQVENESFTECGGTSTVTVLQKGSRSISHSSGTNGSLTSTGQELTVEIAGLHCVFKTNSTKLGTVTGGTPAAFDISTTLPRIGGSSGFFCGSTMQWTGYYELSNPTTLFVTP